MITKTLESAVKNRGGLQYDLKAEGLRVRKLEHSAVCVDPLPPQKGDEYGVLAAVAAVFRTTPEAVRAAVPRRTDMPRMIVAYLLRHDFGLTYQRIATFLGAKHYYTAEYASKRMAEVRRLTPRLDEILMLIRRQYQDPAA